ncbi:hypothetical protein AA3250_2206 [Gluconobacter albidus NBRC 3250]|nr:hypothetical protein AA3250_2206 [Gluconobacter albidus NBRC 3250]
MSVILPRFCELESGYLTLGMFPASGCTECYNLFAQLDSGK